MVIGIDPSFTMTGVSVLDIRDEGTWFSVHCIKPPGVIAGKGSPQSEQVQDIIRRIDVVCREVVKYIHLAEIRYHKSPRGVLVEVPRQYRRRSGKTNTKSLMELSLLVGSLIGVLKQKGYEVVGLPTGGGIPKKELGYDLLRGWGFEFQTNRGFDNSDALIVALYGGMMFGLIPREIAKPIDRLDV